MNIFAVVQYMFWSYLGVFALKNLRDAPVDSSIMNDEQTPWFRKINLGENKYKNTLGAIALLVGTGSLGMIWMFTLKSVRYLILNKGGRHLTFVTYTPFGKNRIMKVPIENICCKEDRKFAKVQLPLKVKNHSMHYMQCPIYQPKVIPWILKSIQNCDGDEWVYTEFIVYSNIAENLAFEPYYKGLGYYRHIKVSLKARINKYDTRSVLPSNKSTSPQLIRPGC
ncbi:unnamed protein product [Pieris brassicae]|uniref:Uncharacterized protein n=1 Tax=Pieris brassicae TaxID=7116 RepID=A0A9P0TQ81_PIEBR|nr:unnamed protein product [Pieris brassicae]